MHAQHESTCRHKCYERERTQKKLLVPVRYWPNAHPVGGAMGVTYVI